MKKGDGLPPGLALGQGENNARHGAVAGSDLTFFGALQEFKDRYNEEWLIERHGHISPSAQRRKLAA